VSTIVENDPGIFMKVGHPGSARSLMARKARAGKTFADKINFLSATVRPTGADRE
jgi:hypothetical protein